MSFRVMVLFLSLLFLSSCARSAEDESFLQSLKSNGNFAEIDAAEAKVAYPEYRIDLAKEYNNGAVPEHIYFSQRSNSNCRSGEALFFLIRVKKDIGITALKKILEDAKLVPASPMSLMSVGLNYENFVRGKTITSLQTFWSNGKTDEQVLTASFTNGRTLTVNSAIVDGKKEELLKSSQWFIAVKSGQLMCPD